MTDDERAAEIAGRCRERLERGEAVDVDAVVREHPELAAPLADAFAALSRLDEAFGREDAAPPPSRVGRTVGPYRLDAELGAGGMGTVYLATLAAPAAGLCEGARVAVKVLHPHMATRRGFRERFLREAEIGRRVVHGNVVRTLDALQATDGGERLHVVVMELVEGRTLRALLDDLGRVPEELCRHVGREVAKALTAIHAAGAVHRDLKPDNVIVTPDHAVKVMDLGVARLIDESLRVSQTGAFVGSVRYAAPEQFGFRRAAGAEGAVPRSATRAARSAKGDDLDGRADLYALGLTLYELATGSHPFAGDEFHVVLRRQLNDVPRPVGELNPQLSPFFEDLLARLVEKDRESRIASAAELVRILEEGEESAWWLERRQAIRAATRRPLRRIRVPRETALYGREAELTLLRSLFDRAAEGDGQVVLIEGEAGIGKSRLVDEFVGQLAQEGEEVNFLFGSYPPGGAATAFGAFSTAYREHLGDDEAVIRAALPQTPLLVPAFAALLRGDVSPAGAEPLTKGSLQTVFVHATRSFAAERPTIVLIDDLHFAPDEGRALFASLALAIPGHRVLLVGCARPGLDERWAAQLAARPQTTRLSLPRLGPKELVRLLRDALKSERLAEELSALIALKSDGNPFFVFELLRGLRDGRFLRQRPDGTWETTQIIRDIRVPSSITELVQARVADLEPEDKNLLDVASCCGFEFDPLVVGQALARDRVVTLQALGRIEKRHRLVRSVGRRFVFDHHQVQEALYAGLSELLREEYHARLGEAVEARSGAASRAPKDVDGVVCVELAGHFFAGAQGAKALRYLEGALTHLERNYLNDAAIRLADHALATPDLLLGTARCELLSRKSARLGLLGRRDEEERSLDEALALADASKQPGLQSRVRTQFGWLLVRTSRHDAAQRALGEALALSRECGDKREEAAAWGSLGGVSWSLGRFSDALERFESNLALARETGDRLGEARATGNLGCVYSSLGRNEDALTQHEKTLTLAREIGNRQGESIAMGNLGMVRFSLGSFDEAQKLFERHLVLAREIGDRHGECVATGNLGCVSRSLGRFAEARTQQERTLALAREIGDLQGQAGACANLGSVAASLGFFDEAGNWFERHRALSRDIGDRKGEATALFSLGLLRSTLGDARAAREAFVESLAISREIGARDVESDALHGLGAVADADGDSALAETSIAESLSLRRALGNSARVADSLIAIGELRRRAGDVDDARTALEEAVKLARDHGRKEQTAQALATLACMPGGDAKAAEDVLADAGDTDRSPRLSFLLWQATGDVRHLVDAARGLDELVARAPAEFRASMIANVRIHREIVAAAREHSIPLAARAS